MGRVLLIWLILLMGMAWSAQAQAAEQRAGERAETERLLLERILKRPAYQRWKLWQEPPDEPAEKSRLAELVKRGLESVWDGITTFFRWIKSLFGKISWTIPKLPDNPANMGEILKKAGWAAFLILLAAAGVYLYGMRRSLKGGVKLAKVISRRKIRSAMENAEALALDHGGWMEVAAQMEAGGDFRAMYRAAYLALLSGLHQRGEIDFRPNRTNWTYVNNFHGPQTRRAEFGALTELFDQVWYGLKIPGEPSIAMVKIRVQDLLAGEGGA